MMPTVSIYTVLMRTNSPKQSSCLQLSYYSYHIIPSVEALGMFVAPCSQPVPYSRHSSYSRHFVQHLVVFLQGFNNSL